LLDEKFANLGSGDELAARIQEKVQGALRMAEERAKEYERRGGADYERRRNRAGSWPPPPPPPQPPRPPRPAAAPVSEEERLMILRMISEGDINVEQAEKLLAALHGRDDR
jgi:hypothetical protein